jgi:hypothetical protein
MINRTQWRHRIFTLHEDAGPATADALRRPGEKPAEWQRIGNQIDAAMITKRANFVKVGVSADCGCISI